MGKSLYNRKIVEIKNLLPLCLLLLIITSQIIYPQNLYFPPKIGTVWETITPESLGWCTDKIDSLYSLIVQGN